jgi:hypothetical protein
MDIPLEHVNPPQRWPRGWEWRPHRLGWWMVWYNLAVIVLLASILVAGPLALIPYLAIGWWLGRYAWRDAMWLSPDASAVSDGAKVWFILTWLWSHPVLIAAAWFARST